MDGTTAATDDIQEGLYETDFYAWTQHQAALLKTGRLNHLDAVNILEEIETLGRKEVFELRSRLRILLAHILKTMQQPTQETRSWKTTILNQRIEIADTITDNPSLKPKLAEVFEKAYQDGRQLAASETGLPLKTFPTHPSFSLEDALSRSWKPTGPERPMSSTGEGVED